MVQRTSRVSESDPGTIRMRNGIPFACINSLLASAFRFSLAHTSVITLHEHTFPGRSKVVARGAEPEARRRTHRSAKANERPAYSRAHESVHVLQSSVFTRCLSPSVPYAYCTGTRADNGAASMCAQTARRGGQTIARAVAETCLLYTSPSPRDAHES
eukprot:4615733-Prymnesium_polylepis.1